MFDSVLFTLQINPGIEKNAIWDFNADFEPCSISGDKKKAIKPKDLRTKEGMKFTKNMQKFYTDILVPVPVPVQDPRPIITCSIEKEKSKHPIESFEMTY